MGAGKRVVAAIMAIFMLVSFSGLSFAAPGDLAVAAAGWTTIITSTPVITAGLYASGQLVGTKISLASATRYSAGTGVVNSIILSDLGKQNAAVDVVFFNADPSATTFTDNATLDVADADAIKILGHISITAADYASFNDNAVATVKNQGLSFKLASGTTLYAAIVCRGTPTYTSTSDLQLTVKIYQD